MLRGRRLGYRSCCEYPAVIAETGGRRSAVKDAGAHLRSDRALPVTLLSDGTCLPQQPLRSPDSCPVAGTVGLGNTTNASPDLTSGGTKPHGEHAERGHTPPAPPRVGCCTSVIWRTAISPSIKTETSGAVVRDLVGWVPASRWGPAASFALARNRSTSPGLRST